MYAIILNLVYAARRILVLTKDAELKISYKLFFCYLTKQVHTSLRENVDFSMVVHDRLFFSYSGITKITNLNPDNKNPCSVAEPGI